MRHHAPTLVAVVAAFALSGCGDQLAETTSAPSADPYAGPLYLAAADAKHPGAGAAGDVVDCDTWGSGGSSASEVYGDGATADTADQALKVARSERLFGGVQEGLRVAKQEDDRVLYVVEVRDRVKQAVIVRDGPATEGAGGPGWYVESWAHCDFSELPRSFTDSIGLGIWTDSSGRPVPTATIESWRGPEHCDWQSMTFLSMGEAMYVREPQPGLGDYFTEPYRPHAELPAGAVDTGLERDGEHLWTSPDEQRAFVGTKADVEVWPRAVESLGCE
jgi:hypothetical protein